MLVAVVLIIVLIVWNFPFGLWIAITSESEFTKKITEWKKTANWIKKKDVRATINFMLRNPFRLLCHSDVQCSAMLCCAVLYVSIVRQSIYVYKKDRKAVARLYSPQAHKRLLQNHWENSNGMRTKLQTQHAWPHRGKKIKTWSQHVAAHSNVCYCLAVGMFMSIATQYLACVVRFVLVSLVWVCRKFLSLDARTRYECIFTYQWNCVDWKAFTSFQWSGKRVLV